MQQLAARLEAVETDLESAKSDRKPKGDGKTRAGESEHKKSKKK